MKRLLVAAGIFLILATNSGCAAHRGAINERTSPKVEGVKAYICPMHPEVRETSPGVCPKCGMNLIESRDDAMLRQSSDPKLKNNYVCMMNNKHFGVDQIPVDVGGKTYYGCCQGCVKSLQTNRAIRFATDPYSGEEVDKADAYIVLNPDNPQTVLYFKSAENYAKYMEKR